MVDRLTIRKPDDWHLHVRDNEMLKAVLPFTARHFGRAILMPNLIPPVRTTADAIAYRQRVMAALPAGSTFKPLMTCYLTDETDPDDVERGFREGIFTGVKLYPAHATTNSAAGVTDFNKIRPVLARMEKIGMRFLMHGEVTDADVDIFDREKVFIDRYLSKWIKRFPGLRFILEHLSSKDGAEFVKSAAPQVGGTITPYHMVLTRTDWLGWGLKPYMYCMPVIKTAKDRAALRKAATSGETCYFLGTDSAPHPVARKLSVPGKAALRSCVQRSTVTVPVLPPMRSTVTVMVPPSLPLSPINAYISRRPASAQRSTTPASSARPTPWPMRSGAT